MSFILSIQAYKAEGSTVKAIQPPTVSLQSHPSLDSILLTPRFLVCSQLFGYDRLETNEFDCAMNPDGMSGTIIARGLHEGIPNALAENAEPAEATTAPPLLTATITFELDETIPLLEAFPPDEALPTDAFDGSFSVSAVVTMEGPSEPQTVEMRGSWITGPDIPLPIQLLRSPADLAPAADYESADESPVQWIDMRLQEIRQPLIAQPGQSLAIVGPATRKPDAARGSPTSQLIRATGTLLQKAADVIDTAPGMLAGPRHLSYADAAERVFAHALDEAAMSTVIDVTTSAPGGGDGGGGDGGGGGGGGGNAGAGGPGGVGGTTAPSRTTPPPPPPNTTTQPCIRVGASGFNPNPGTKEQASFVFLGDSINVGGGRAWRDNNPGMMRAGPGMLGRDGFGPPGPFAIFPNLQAGWNAAWGQLYSPRYQVLNLQDAIAQWAPASENDVGAYVSFVSKATGILPTTPMATLTAGQMTSVLTAMYRNEGNQPGQTFHRGDPNLPQWARDLFGAPRC